MAIACGNLFTRNIYKDFLAPDCTPRQEAVAKLVAFPGTKLLGAFVFVLKLQTHLRHSTAIAGRHLDGPDSAGGAAGIVCAAQPWGPLAGWAAGRFAGSWMARRWGSKPTYVCWYCSDLVMAALSALVLDQVAAMVSLIANAAWRGDQMRLRIMLSELRRAMQRRFSHCRRGEACRPFHSQLAQMKAQLKRVTPAAYCE